MTDHAKAPGAPMPIPVDEDGNRLCPWCGDLLVEYAPGRWQCATWAEIDRAILSELQQIRADREEDR